MIFKKLFGTKQQEESKPIYHIVDVDASDLTAYPDGIDQLQNMELDGFIIRNVFSQEELSKLIESHDKIGNDKKYFSDTGMAVFPTPFSRIDQTSANSKQQMEQFHIDAVELWGNFPNNFGVDFEGRIHKVLTNIAGGRLVESPRGMEGIGMYNPAVFKHLLAGEGHFKAHCGNLFHKEFPSFYEHMNEISIIENQMSYFVMLDPSEKGGELTLYDVLWADAEKRMNGDTVLQDKSGNLLDLNNQKQVKRQYLSPRAGDMIVFSGGRIWHKVELAQSTRRLTCGGFLTRSRTDDQVYTWS